MGLRSPELIFGDKPSKDQDVWSFGCLLFEFITGRTLFVVVHSEDYDEDNDDHLLQFFDILGKLPEFLLSNWSRSSTYFDSSGKQIKNYVGDLPEGFDPQSCTSPSLEEQFDNEKPPVMSIEDSKACKRLLRWILQYDATQRPSTRELLEDPWFAESDPSGKDVWGGVLARCFPGV